MSRDDLEAMVELRKRNVQKSKSPAAASPITQDRARVAMSLWKREKPWDAGLIERLVK
jgi:hypothetical protein